jgi:DNA-binding MarR family transcriptional regulator
VARTKGSRLGSGDAPGRALGDVLSFMQLLWAIAHGLEAISKRMRKTLGVTGPQRLVVRLVGRYGETTPSVLADVLHVHPSSLTGVLRRLEHAGLLRRVRDPADGRRALLTLTPNGQALNDQDRGTVEYAVRRSLRAVAVPDVEAARRLLALLARELGVEDAEQGRSRQPRRFLLTTPAMKSAKARKRTK